LELCSDSAEYLPRLCSTVSLGRVTSTIVTCSHMVARGVCSNPSNLSQHVKQQRTLSLVRTGISLLHSTRTDRSGRLRVKAVKPSNSKICVFETFNDKPFPPLAHESLSKTTMDRYEAYRAVYGKEGFEKLQAAKILIVGAGGIGCEILKNMVLMGFRSIDIVDLDTIDVSNLNRQFLFRPEHIGKSKALVACEAAKRFNPECTVTPHHGNIKDDMFNLNYVKGFACVLNALDNVDARRHVNRLCLSAGVPLIDSGSTGYKGQVRPIFKGVTECYECREKPTQKVYPICTIRSTPDKPVHCIVWAKEAFKLVFGNTPDSMLYEDPAVEQSTYMDFVAYPALPGWAGASGASDAAFGSAATVLVGRGLQLLDGLFRAEVTKRQAMDVFKTAKITPVATAAGVLENAASRAIAILLASRGDEGERQGHVRPSKETNWDKSVWSDEDCAVEALLCYAETALHNHAQIGHLAFDKDDSSAMTFVTACANLRSRVFGIPAQCLYDAKGVAGNIIPAIATTNAIVAAVQVEQACRVVVAGAAVVALLRNTSVWRIPTSRRRDVLSCLRYVEQPLDSCFVCQKNPLTLTIDTTAATLQDLVSKVLKGRLGFNAPSVSVGPDPIYEEGEGCDEDLADNLPLLLCECPAGGIHQHSELTIEDFTQDMDVLIVVNHAAAEDIQAELLRRQESQSSSAGKKEGDASAPPPDDLFYIDGGKAPVAAPAAQPANSYEEEAGAGKKRPAVDAADEGADGGVASPTKRAKTVDAHSTREIVVEL